MHSRRHILSPGQLFFLTFCYLFGALMPGSAVYGAGDAAWLAALAAAISGLITAILLFTVGQKCRHPLPNRLDRHSPFSVTLLCLFLPLFLFTAGGDLASLSGYLHMFSLRDLPPWLPTLLIACFCVLAAGRGLNAIGRLSLAVAPALILPLLLLILPFFLPGASLPPIPHEVNGGRFVLSALLTYLSSFAELSALLFLLPHTVTADSPKESAAAKAEDRRAIAPAAPFALAILCGCVFAVVAVVRDQAVLGPLTAALSYPATRVSELVAETDLHPLLDFCLSLIIAIRCAVKLGIAGMIAERLLPQVKLPLLYTCLGAMPVILATVLSVLPLPDDLVAVLQAVCGLWYLTLPLLLIIGTKKGHRRGKAPDGASAQPKKNG